MNRPMVPARNPGRSPRGQSLVEFALAIPVFMLLVLGLVEGAGYAFALSSLQRAAQEGGRLAALPGTLSEDAVRARVINRAQPLVVSSARVVVSVNNSTRTFVQRTSGDRVLVAVDHDYQPLTSAVLGGIILELHAQSEYAVE